MSEIIIEACVETLEEAIHAEARGAHRLELCAELDQEGLTPTIEVIQAIRSHCKIPVKVMLRPRPGDFCYSGQDIDIIMSSKDQLLGIGIDAIVFGAVSEGKLDIELIKEVCSDKRLISLTIHKAIDTIDDPYQAILEIKQEICPLIRDVAILSSGGRNTAEEGKERLAKMAKICGNEVELIAAGKITSENLKRIKAEIPVSSFHGRKIV